MNGLGAGFLEAVYKNALFISLKEHGFKVDVEKRFEITVIIKLKCCEALAGEHQAQLINYLRASNLPIGLLINFGKARIDHKRIYNPVIHLSKEPHNPILLARLARSCRRLKRRSCRKAAFKLFYDPVIFVLQQTVVLLTSAI